MPPPPIPCTCPRRAAAVHVGTCVGLRPGRVVRSASGRVALPFEEHDTVERALWVPIEHGLLQHRQATGRQDLGEALLGHWSTRVDVTGD